MTRLKWVGLLIAAIALVTPNIAAALDIPLLTWERGRVQEVVLGGGAVTNHWTVELVGQGQKPLIFSASKANAAGYIVYSLSLPDSLPLGAYSIATLGTGSPQTIVAGVNVVVMSVYSVTTVPQDLAFIIAMIAFLTASISAMRARKYSHISFINTQRALSAESGAEFEDLSSYDITLPKNRFISTARVSHLRTRLMSGLPRSLFRFLLVRDGELAHRISPMFYSVLPLVGVVGAFVASVEVSKAGGLAKTGVAAFLAIALLGIFDAFSGLFATLSFWLIQLFLGNVSSFRDLMVMVALGICWVAPGLFGTLFRDITRKDFVTTQKPQKDLIRYLGLLEAGIVGGALFYLGQKLITSLLATVTSTRHIGLIDVCVVGLAVIIKALADDLSSKSLPQSIEGKLESIEVKRVSSPQTAIGLFAVFFAFSYIWTQSSSKSLLFAVLFAAPYFLLFIRFDMKRVSFMTTVRRNIFGESLLVAGVTLAIFVQVRGLPLLSTQKSGLFLLLAGIPGLIHAFYSAVCDSAERKGTISE